MAESSAHHHQQAHMLQQRYGNPPPPPAPGGGAQSSPSHAQQQLQQAAQVAAQAQQVLQRRLSGPRLGELSGAGGRAAGTPPPLLRPAQSFDAATAQHFQSGSAPASPRLLPRRSRLQPPLAPPGHPHHSPPPHGAPPPPPPPPPPRPAPPPPPDPLCDGFGLGLGGFGGFGGGLGGGLLLLDDEDDDELGASPGGVDWQRRCLELQLELHRLRLAAGRVRDSLRDKLTELEQRALTAEARADEAEDRVRQMEKRLAATPLAPHAAQGPQQQQQQQRPEGEQGEAGAAAQAVTGPPEEAVRQQTITQLETAVEEQRQLRLADARQVEAKAARIKQWVTHKLRELEAQNALLREQNLRCAAQLELLRAHLAASQHATAATATSAQHASPQPHAPHLLAAGTARSSTAGSSSRASLSLDATTASDESLGLSTLPLRPALSAHSLSSGASLDVAVGEAVEPLYAEVGLRLGGGVPAPAPSPAPMDAAAPASAAAATLGRDLHAAVAALSLAGPANNNNNNNNNNMVAADDAVHDYAEIYTPSRERVPWLATHGGSTSSGVGGGEAGEEEGEGKPPTPPLHRFPSWESRIYQVAAEGLTLAPPPPPAPPSPPSQASQAQPQTATPQQQHRPHGYRDIPVPVYATVKGRASQIRSVPFTGDSSDDDSSDGEGGGGGGGGASEAAAAAAVGAGRAPSSGGDTDTSLSGGSGSSPSKSHRTASSLSPAKRSSCGSPCKSMRRDTSFESGLSDDYAIPPDAMSCESGASGLEPIGGPPTAATGASSMPSSLLLRASASLDATASNTGTGRRGGSSSREEAEGSGERAGHLAKLGGKLKTWRKRWFVLKDGHLSYWRSASDAAAGRKPQARLPLDDTCRIGRPPDGGAAFEVATGARTYYLAADNAAAAEEWVRALSAAQRRAATRLLLARDGHRPAAQGWLTKVKNGRARRCWCVLVGRAFLYFKTPCDTNPVGQINMREARVEEVERVSDSEEEEEGEVGDGADGQVEYTIGIFPQHQGPTYLLMPSKQDKDTWLYHLTVVSGGGPSAGTQYEQLVQKLMETDGDPNCVLWRHPHLLYTKESIVSPLTTLSSEALQAEAIKLFKSCQLFISVALDSAGIDYHVVLAQNALQQCLDAPELQAELICALVKQTSRHTHHRIGVQVTASASSSSSSRRRKLRHKQAILLLCATQSLFACDASSSSSSSGGGGTSGPPPGGGGGGGGGATSGGTTSQQRSSPTSVQAAAAGASGSGGGGGGSGGSSGGGGILDCKTNPPAFVFVQGWQLLALAVSLFVPKNNRLLWYLKLHLHRNADSKTECGKYAAYCQRALERTLQNGAREARPSRMEVLSILLKNPFHHSLPHSIPVHLLNGQYQVVGFDGSSTVEEFVATLNAELGCRDAALNGFTLFSDDPIDRDLEHFLDHNAKLCDVISKWETALREKGSGKFENSRCIQLTYKNRLYWRSGAKMETERERLLLVYQTNQQVLLGRFPLSRELALELAALMAQIDLGEFNAERGRGSGGTGGGGAHAQQQALVALDRFYPYRYRDGLTPDELKDLQERLADKWAALKGRSLLDCVRIYLTCTRKWPFFGAALFQARLKHSPTGSSPPVPEAAAGPMVWLAVAEDAVTLLDLSAMQPIARYPYGAVVTFGGCQDDFMLVVGAEDPGAAPQKLLFALSKPKILELTLLIADYMNAMGHTLPGTPQMGTLTRNGSHRSLRSRPNAGGVSGSATGHTSTMSSAGGSFANHHHHDHMTILHARAQPQQPVSQQQPDILKSTPDHQLHRTDSKKRAHLDSGVA